MRFATFFIPFQLAPRFFLPVLMRPLVFLRLSELRLAIVGLHLKQPLITLGRVVLPGQYLEHRRLLLTRKVVHTMP